MMLSIIGIERHAHRAPYHCDMPHEGVEQDEHEREHLLHEIERLNGQMEEAVLANLLQYLIKMSLTIPQLRVLMLLVTSGKGATGRDLAASFGVSMASMSTMLDRLVSQGVAARTLDPDDHRVRRVHATPLGTSVVRRLLVTRPFRSDILVRLRVEDLRALEQGFRAVSEQIALMDDTE